MFVLVGMCFFGSMIITNDVALITFVPFTFIVLKKLDANECGALTVPIVCMQTIAANLGSMLTPIGNPQNLYLYSKSGMSIGSFIVLMLPYSLLSLILLIIWIAVFSHRKEIKYTCVLETATTNTPNQKIIIMDAMLFLICLLVVFRALHYAVAFAAVLICNLCMDRNALKQVDYSLLLTFVAFFVFIGNLGRVPVFSEWLQNILDGREVPRVSARIAGYQQRPRSTSSVRIHHTDRWTHHWHESGRTGNPHCFNGQSDFLQTNCS